MKKILLLILLVSSAIANAQSFEGIISWKMALNITDPKVKQQMEDAEKKLAEPETQAQMKEMKAKMDDPQMKAMLEANPQMKAQMEAALKMAEGGGMQSLIPKSYTMKMKDSNVLTSMEGGAMGNVEMLFITSKLTSYMIKREAKTYSIMPKQEQKDEEKEKTDVKITKTSETAKILGYTCTKFVAEGTEGNVKQIFWTTTAIPFDLKGLANQKMSGQQAMYYKQLEGVPLKIEMSMPQGTMVMEATEVKKQSLPASDFVVPAGYKEVPFGIF